MLKADAREKTVLCSMSSSVHKVEITGEKIEPPFSRICNGNDNFITQTLLSVWNKCNQAPDSGDAAPGTNPASALSWVHVLLAPVSRAFPSAPRVFTDISFKTKNFPTLLDLWDDWTVFRVWLSTGSNL